MGDSQWLVVFLAALLVLVLLAVMLRERRLRQRRAQADREHAARLLEQQRQAETNARAHQQALFNSMAEGVLLLDANGAVQFVNDCLRRIFSLPSGCQGQTVVEVFHLPVLAELAEQLPGEKGGLGIELELDRPAPRFLEVNASALRDREGLYQGGILVFHDVTRIKQLEATRQEFVGNVSHELRTPLSLIKGFVETLLDGALDEPEQARPFLRTIQKHADRLTYLIEDLLTISKLESAQVALNRQTVSVRSAAERVQDGLKARASGKQARIEILVPPDLFVDADADRLEQVLFNLVENAVKYGGSPGRVEIGGERRDRMVEVRVSDNGRGIPPEAQARIFERFYRVDRARSRETGGTGLGLAIVKHIVLAHGGEVWVESEPGQGATFHFTLPAANSA